MSKTHEKAFIMILLFETSAAQLRKIALDVKLIEMIESGIEIALPGTPVR